MVIGLSHRTAPLAVRERFWISDNRRPEALTQLNQAEGIDEVIVLAASDRTDFLLWASDATLAANSILRFLTAHCSLTLCEWNHFYRLLDTAALIHVFQVASGLDSAVPGETQVLPELQNAWRLAQEVGASSRFLDAVVQKACAVAERVRNEIAPGQSEAAAPPLGSESVVEARKVIEDEAQAFHRKLLSERVVPTIVALRNRLDEICQEELKHFKHEYGPLPRDQDALFVHLASRITRRIAGSLARELKEPPGKAEQAQLAIAVERLFHLEKPEKAAAAPTSEA